MNGWEFIIVLQKITSTSSGRKKSYLASPKNGRHFTVHQQIEQGGCRWNQEPQELVKEAERRKT